MDTKQMHGKYLYKSRQSIIVCVVLLTQRDKAGMHPKNKIYYCLMKYALVIYCMQNLGPVL